MESSCPGLSNMENNLDMYRHLLSPRTSAIVSNIGLISLHNTSVDLYAHLTIHIYEFNVYLDPTLNKIPVSPLLP